MSDPAARAPPFAMNTPHHIRLHGPWEYEVIDVGSTTGDVAPGQRGRFQFHEGWNDAVGEGFSGTLRLTRRFNSPTGLGAHNRVWLVIDAVTKLVGARLNDHALEPVVCDDGSCERDVTDWLGDRNLLSVEVTHASMTGPLLTGVRLEIRDS